MTNERANTQEEVEERRVHHPCPACGALVMVPERADPSRGFVCPSCKVHLWDSQGHLHLVWNHDEVSKNRADPA